MITIKNISISYNKNKKVIDELNLTLKDKLIHGIVGMNGAGKTTLLNSIFGIKNIDSGQILYNQEKISKKNIAYLPAENYFYSNITGKEYLSLIKNQYFDLNKWNQLFNLPLNKIIDTYSSGMKKKLALLFILKQNKPIIILDEPYNGLDIEMSNILYLILSALKNTGKTIIITSHIIESLTNICDYIHLLENGAIKYSTEKSEFENFRKNIFGSIQNKNLALINELI